MPTELIKEVIKETAENISDKIDELFVDIFDEEQKLTLSEFKDNSILKIKTTLENLSNSRGVFEKSGFLLSGMAVSLDLPPKIVADFTVTSQISKEEMKSILEESEENKIIKIILSCLFKAQEYFDKIKFSDYQLKSINITLGLLPGVVIKFGK